MALKLTPHPYQEACIQDAVQFLSTATPDMRRLYAAPTGCGKSVMELAILDRLPDGLLITPRDEIVHGMVDKGGDPEKLWTPVMLRNRLLSGSVAQPGYILVDESHHDVAEVWEQIGLLSGLVPAVGFTATPYRGTPRSTRRLLEKWGDPIWVITDKEAAEAGFISTPTFQILPLVDDDIVEVRGGEFDVTSLEAATVDRLGDLAEHSRRWYEGGLWDLPTCFSLPGSSSSFQLQEELGKRGVPSAVVHAGTPREDRALVFRAVEERVLALIHINIVSEGVDLKLRRLVDAAPTLSPVRFVQQVGRIRRPWDRQPEYVGTNRNILRHSYALEGAVPTSALVEAQKLFQPSERDRTRVLGLEALGRFKPTTAKLSDGLTLHTYSLSALIGSCVVEFCAVVHPAYDPVWASRIDQVVDGKRVYGSWKRCEPPTDLKGFSSIAPKAPSEKQMNWWRRSALRHGLDPEQELTRKSFQVLPVLSDLGVRFR